MISSSTSTYQTASPSLLYIINHAPFFASHRLPIAQAALSEGFRVCAATGKSGIELQDSAAAELIKRSTISHYILKMTPDGVNPFVEFMAFIQLIFVILKVKPDIIHTASPKANLYGSLAARLLRIPHLVISISGMGYLYTGERTIFKKVLRTIFQLLLSFGFRHSSKRIIVQNTDDFATLIQSRLAQKDELVLIPGSGVDFNSYPPPDLQQKSNQIILPARLLKDKGVEEFVQAARLLKPRYPDWRFILAGAGDYANPSAISAEQLSTWVKEGIIEAWGHVSRMSQVFANASIVCLPSYREGMPKALQEAAAAGCPIITTDTIGCREAIEPGESGILVPIKNSNALAEAIASLINSPPLRKAYGESGRRLAETRFSLSSIVAQNLSVYRSLLSKKIS